MVYMYIESLLLKNKMPQKKTKNVCVWGGGLRSRAQTAYGCLTSTHALHWDAVRLRRCPKDAMSPWPAARCRRAGGERRPSAWSREQGTNPHTKIKMNNIGDKLEYPRYTMALYYDSNPQLMETIYRF